MEKLKILALHGITGHRTHLQALSRFYEQHGLEVRPIDLLGFGHTTSSGKGDIGSFHEYIFEIKNVIHEIKVREPDAKIILMGEGIGGLIALLFAIEHQKEIRALILMNPMTGTNWKFSWKNKVLLSVFGTLWPEKYFNLPFRPQDFCDDDQVCESIEKDSVVVRRITARFWWAFVKATLEVKAEAYKITIPVLMQLSREDKIYKSVSSLQIFQKIHSFVKKAEEYEIPHSMVISRQKEIVFNKQWEFITNTLHEKRD